MEMNYSLRIWKKDDTILIKLPYEDFELNASNHFRSMVKEITDSQSCKCLILDFSDVLLLDQNAIAVLVYSLNVTSASSIKLVMCSLRESVLDFLTDKGTLSIFDVLDNVHDALDFATNFIISQEQLAQSTKSIESIFGSVGEEDISY